MARQNQLVHGARAFISAAAPSAQTAAAYNASAFTSGANAYREIPLCTNFGDQTTTYTTGSVQTTDRNTPLKVKEEAHDPGTVQLTFVTDDDAPGSALLRTAIASKSQYTVKVLIERENTNALPGGHDEDDKAIYYRGFLESKTDSAGAQDAFFMGSVTINLTVDPLVN